MPDLWRILLPLLFLVPFSPAQETHGHGAPEKLGRVSFPISCMPAVQYPFDRGVALLHSFAYTAAEETFRGVAELDPRCGMAHWGVAMTYFHQLWDPPIEPGTTSIAQKEIQRAQQIGAGSERERQFIHALSLLYQDAAAVPYSTRVLHYEQAMGTLAAGNKKDVEAQLFYALALLANASPTRNTRVLLITSSMHTTMQSSHRKASRQQEPTPRLHPPRPTRCICHRIYSRDSAFGKTLSAPTLRRGRQHNGRVTQEKNSTPWIIWCMPTCRVDVTMTRPKSFNN
jgi:hypothetical protein